MCTHACILMGRKEIDQNVKVYLLCLAVPAPVFFGFLTTGLHYMTQAWR